MNEKDPNGINQHEPGAKLDAGKQRPALVYMDFIHALDAVFQNGTYGANKYSESGWKQVPSAKARYLDAGFRHFNKWVLGETHDEESGSHHLAAFVWNILAVLELELITSESLDELTRLGQEVGDYD